LTEAASANPGRPLERATGLFHFNRGDLDVAVTLEVPTNVKVAHRPAQHAFELGTESAFAVGARASRLAAAGRDVVRLEIGQPDWRAPDAAVEAAITALRDGETAYAPPAGLPALRAAISARSAERGYPIDPGRVFVLPGGKPGLFFAAQLLLEPGDEALIPDPGFPIYPSVVRFTGATPVPYSLRAGNDFVVDPDRIEQSITDRTRLLFLNAPHNPTGTVIPRAVLERLARLSLDYGFTIVADEVYQDLQFDGRATTIAAFPEIADRAILVDSLSKRFGMTGWRLGWAVVPDRLAEAFERLTINTVSCVPPFVQRAGIAALAEPANALAARVRLLREKRDTLVTALNTIDGVHCALPAGGLYVFPSIGGLIDRRGAGSDRNGDAAWLSIGTERIASRLLEEHALAALPGTGFGAGGEGHLRLSFATSFPQLEAAVARLRAFASELESHG
jgi:aspartate/methionine/tyrosine aminotransferase